MVEERFTEDERQAVKEALIRSMPRSGVDRVLLGALRKIEGVDTEIICRRAYPSKATGD